MNAEYSRKVKETVKRWFVDHQVTQQRFGTQGLQAFWFKKKGTSVYGVHYYLDNGYLVVTGDLGEAIYLSGLRTLFDWAACDIDYFHSKCRASEGGSGVRWWDWDDDVARTNWDALLTDLNETGSGFDPEFIDKSVEALETREAWYEFCREQYWEGKSWPSDLECFDIGAVIPMRCFAHLYGLKTALTEDGNGQP